MVHNDFKYIILIDSNGYGAKFIILRVDIQNNFAIVEVRNINFLKYFSYNILYVLYEI